MRAGGLMIPGTTHGAYRELIVLDQRAVVRAPIGSTHRETCTLPMKGLTARLSLDLLDLQPGQVMEYRSH